MPQIEVTFDIDANGIMNISAKDKGTGKENKITIKSDSGLSKEEIDKMIAEAEANAEADKKQRELIEARNGAEAQLYNFKKDYEEVKDVLSDENRSKFESEVTALEEAIKGDDVSVINKKLGDLFSVAQPILEAKQNKEKAASTSDNQTVDAEFTEVKAA